MAHRGQVVPEGGIDQGKCSTAGMSGRGRGPRKGGTLGAGTAPRGWARWAGTGCLLLAEPTQKLQLLQGGQKWAQQEGPMGSQCPPLD